MKAAIYSRKSKFTGKGDSIENQIQLCMDYSKSIGIKEFLVYEDEGFSGGNIDRPQFKKMMQDAKDKKFDCLVCYRLDRISRNVSDFSTLIEKLNKLEISFISIKEQFDTSTPMGRAMMFISSVFAQLERETIAERIKDNMYELARSGRWLGGKTPHGFTSKKISFLDENLKERSMYQLEVNDEQMEIVKLIGSDVLPDDQKLTLEIARVIRLGFLQQNAFHDQDTCVPLKKQLLMMKTILYLYEKSSKLIAMGIPMSILKQNNIFEKVIAIKYDIPNNKLSMFDDYKVAIDDFYAKIIEEQA